MTCTYAELNWLAGLMEGDGCFTVHVKGPYRRPQITLGMSDEDTIRRAHAIATVGHVNGPYTKMTPAGKPGKPVWRWTVSDQADAAGLMMMLFPLMGQRRQERIRRILLDWRK